MHGNSHLWTAKTVKNPCYSKSVGDCPDRKAGCQANCRKWAKHKQDREEVYKLREKKNAEIDTLFRVRRTRGRDLQYGGD